MPDGLDGRSLLPLLNGRTEGCSDEVYSELWGAENGFSVMVKRGSLSDPIRFFWQGTYHVTFRKLPGHPSKAIFAR